ncbi:ArsR family transcriptional regulator [Hasllibacter halocynthiae]|uniref:ArsR family transcriptional regulator n=1 Tax=Hasllibacter halocynthiae TaxID=595589 RepID=A0A2T0X3Q3_9RHOB|nr:ArsR family transcriptional regulator [Hasllibacter halocynthiae]
MARSADLDAVFAALAEPNRRAILRLLLLDDMAVTDVAEGFDISLAAVSKHLRVLSRAGLIAQERRGRLTWCKLEPDAMRAAATWLASVGGFEALDLDAFERFLEGELPDAQRCPNAAAASEEEAEHLQQQEREDDEQHDVDEVPHGAPSLPVRPGNPPS